MSWYPIASQVRSGSPSTSGSAPDAAKQPVSSALLPFPEGVRAPLAEAYQPGYKQLESLEKAEDRLPRAHDHRRGGTAVHLLAQGYQLERMPLGGVVRQDQVAARGHPLAERPDDPVRVVGVGGEVEHRREQHADRLGEID